MAQRLGGRSSQVGVFGALPHGTREELRGEHTGIQTEITHFMASLSTRELKPLNVEDFLSRVRPCSETGSDQHRATYLHSHDPRREGQNPEVRAGQTKTEVVPRNFPGERKDGSENLQGRRGFRELFLPLFASCLMSDFSIC